MDANDLLLSKAEVMKRLGVSDRTLRRLVKQGRLAAVKLGKTSPLKFRQLDLARCIESASGLVFPGVNGAPGTELAP
jgi:excisionase family DNA binding protein